MCMWQRSCHTPGALLRTGPPANCAIPTWHCLHGLSAGVLPSNCERALFLPFQYSAHFCIYKVSQSYFALQPNAFKRATSCANSAPVGSYQPSLDCLKQKNTPYKKGALLGVALRPIFAHTARSMYLSMQPFPLAKNASACRLPIPILQKSAHLCIISLHQSCQFRLATVLAPGH